MSLCAEFSPPPRGSPEDGIVEVTVDSVSEVLAALQEIGGLPVTVKGNSGPPVTVYNEYDLIRAMEDRIGEGSVTLAKTLRW